jgi:hypothetical protein
MVGVAVDGMVVLIVMVEIPVADNMGRPAGTFTVPLPVEQQFRDASPWPQQKVV